MCLLEYLQLLHYSLFPICRCRIKASLCMGHTIQFHGMESRNQLILAFWRHLPWNSQWHSIFYSELCGLSNKWIAILFLLGILVFVALVFDCVLFAKKTGIGHKVLSCCRGRQKLATDDTGSQIGWLQFYYLYFLITFSVYLIGALFTIHDSTKDVGSDFRQCMIGICY